MNFSTFLFIKLFNRVKESWWRVTDVFRSSPGPWPCRARLWWTGPPHTHTQTNHYYNESMFLVNLSSIRPERSPLWIHLNCSRPLTLRPSICASCWQHRPQSGCSFVRLNSPRRSQELHSRLLEKPRSLQASDDSSAPQERSCSWGGGGDISHTGVD